MPKFSIIIPTYNVEAYIDECLESVARQTYDDFEVIVVNDKSSDKSEQIAQRRAKADQRFRVVTHDINRGLHRARMTGVAEATGDFALFLDADDVLEDEGVLLQLSQLVDATEPDVLRFGLRAVATDGMSDEAAEGFTSWSNAWSETLPGEGMARLVFDARAGYGICWHMSHRLFKTAVLKAAFAAMSDQRLERAEDAYEYFVLTTFVEREVCASEIMGYRYRMGAGVTNAHDLSCERFAREVRAMRACYDAAFDYARTLGNEEYLVYARGLKYKLVESAANMWNERIVEADRDAAAQEFVSIVGAGEAGHEFWRFVRDTAYGPVTSGVLPAKDHPLFAFVELARSTEDFQSDDPDVRGRYRAMQSVANDHMKSIYRGLSARERDNEQIRIFVTTHKHVDAPPSGVFQTVQVGPGLKSHRFLDAFHDDDGQNISHLNNKYCELTTQYWAWKNVDADYVGFCHYRRYFSFVNPYFPENPFGEIIDDFIDATAVERYGFDDETVRRCVEGFDVITTGFHDLREFPVEFVGEEGTPRSQWQAAPRLHDDDLELMVNIVHQMQPEYALDMDAFLNGHLACFCNMYIMRQSIFHEYCEWLFPLLEEFCARRDMSLYSHESLRTPGHLAERLFNVYYLHALRTGVGWRTKQLQCVHFEHPDRAYNYINSVCEWRNDLLPSRVVPIVLAADDNYVPMLTTTILSILQNAAKDRFYDIVVFEKDIPPRRKDEIVRFFSNFPNASIRFHNVWRQVTEYHLATSNDHISIETYYRFLIQDVLPGYDKVVYLDSDLVVTGDVAQLFDTDVEGMLLAATDDIDFVGSVCGADPARAAYTRDVLKLVNPYAYFQAGVLVLNTAELRRLHTVGEWLEIAARGGFIYDDQDILNAECQGRVVRLEPEWNVTHNCDGRVENVYSFAPAAMFDAYQDARNHPQVIHYAGYEKPWTWLRCEFAQVYWTYARQIPFYEELIDRVAQKSDERHDEWLALQRALEEERERNAIVLPPKAIGEKNPLRYVVDPIAPLGSRRRETLKRLGRRFNEWRGHVVSVEDPEPNLDEENTDEE